MERIWSFEQGRDIGSTDGRNIWDSNDRLQSTRYGNQVFERGSDRLLGTWHGNQFYGPGGEHRLGQYGNTTFDPHSGAKINGLY